MKMRCCVPNCENNKRVKNSSYNRITFHLFPKDLDQRAAWISALNIADWTPSNRTVICSDHFQEDDFHNTKQGCRRIKPGAIPVTDDECVVPVASRICKICLNLDGKMYSIKDYKLDKMYENITGILPRVDTLGRLPQHVCWECRARLASAADFRDKVLLSDTLLQDLLKNDHLIRIGDILKLQAQHKTLKSTLNTKKLVSVSFEPIDVIKTETVDVLPQNSELEFTVNETNSIEIKEDNDGATEEFPNSDTVETEVEMASITEINLPVEGRQDFAFEDVKSDFSENDVISEDDNVEDIDRDENSKDLQSDNKTAFILNTNYLDRNIVNDIVGTINDEAICVNNAKSESVMILEKIKTDDVKMKKEPTRRMKAGKNQTERKRKKKQPYVKPMKPLDENVITVTSLTREQLEQEILMRKDSERYAQAPYKCTVCYIGFNTQERQARHALKHSEKSGPLKCEICKIRVKLGRDLRAHMKRTHTVEFSCKLCPFLTRVRNVAMGHVKFHAGDTYTCPQCQQQFEKKTTLLNHQRLKHMSDCVCELCGYTFVNKNGVTAHKKIKHKFDDINVVRAGPYCAVCDVKFLTQNAYDKHLRLSSKHISEDDPNRLSNVPSIKTRRIGNYNRKPVRRPVLRRRDVYAAKLITGPVTCEQCDLQFENCGSYTQHFRSAHPGLNRTQFTSKNIPYMCEHCGKMFANATTLADHMWVHTGEKRFQCDHCSKTFSTKSNIAIHMRQHEARRRTFECPVCGKQFMFSHNRTRHMFLHTGLKPFKCDVCEKQFSSSGELRAHVDHVHLNKPRPKRRRTKKRDVTNVEY